MKNSHELNQEIKALQARVQAMSNQAKEENRDFTAEEQTEIDSIVGTDSAEGRISALIRDRDRQAKIEAHVASVAKAMDEREAQPARKIPARTERTAGCKRSKTNKTLTILVSTCLPISSETSEPKLTAATTASRL